MTIVIATLLILVGITYLFLYEMPDNGDFFSMLASRLLNKSVTIQSANLNLFSRYPQLTLHKVQLQSTPKLHLDNLTITIDAEKSWHEKKWISKQIIINHLKLQIDHDTKTTNQTSNISGIVEWIAAQPSIVLRQADIDFCRTHTICYHIRNFNFTTIHTHQHDTLSGFGNVILNSIPINNLHIIIHDFSNPQLQIQGDVRQSFFPGPLFFDLHTNKESTNAVINNPSIAGRIAFLNKKNALIKIQLTHLSIHTNATTQKIPALNPAKIPPLFVNVNQLQIDHVAFGRWILITHPQKNGLSISQLRSQSPLMTLIAHGAWNTRGRATQTRLSGIVTCPNVGNLLVARHLTSRLIGGNYKSIFSLTWPNSPQSFSLKNVRGKINVRLENARILSEKEEKQKGASSISFGDILNIISLETITRVLTLDFLTPEKTKPGFHFYYLQGDVNLQQGFLSSNNMVMDSPTAKINFSGNIDLTAQRNDVTMHVFPYLAPDKISMAGFPIGPLIRLPIWIGKKIVSLFINPFIQMDYHVTGTLKNPIVKKI